MTDSGHNPSPEPQIDGKQLLKLAIELGPLLAFLIAYFNTDILVATGVLMAATLVSLAASKLLLGHVAMMPVVTAVLVCIFGGLTIYLQDPRFIKVKPTILYALFGGALMVGLAMGKHLLKYVFGEAFRLTDQGWRLLTLRWAVFFFALAAANETVWRNFSEETWVNFKVFGFLPLTMVFAAAQIGLIKHYEQTTET